MARQKHQKIKIMRILDHIRHAEGLENGLSTKQLCEILLEEEIPCDRRTLSDDIEILSEYINDNPDYDFNICAEKTPHGYRYYSIRRLPAAGAFSVDELKSLINSVNTLHLTDDVSSETTEQLKKKLIALAPADSKDMLLQYANDESCYPLDTAASKILIDSINSLSFIRNNSSDHIIDTIIKLSDIEDRSALDTEKNNPVFSGHSSSGITVYEIDRLFRAIKDQKKISFRYFDLDENHSHVYRHNGEEYVTEPLALVPNDGHYYLICYDSTTEEQIRTFRIDRMSSISHSSEPISEKAKQLRNELPAYTGQVFRMFSGPLKNVTLRFGNKLISHVFDKFGEQAQITRIDKDTCEITAPVRISPPFWGWLFQFSGKMEIVAPKDAVKEYAKRCKSTYKSMK